MHGDKRSTKPGMPGPPPSSQDLETEHRRDRMETLPDMEAPPAWSPPGERAAGSVPGPSSRSAPGPLGAAPPARHVETKTVPGGGVNRVSDGRAAAAAYIGVNTVGPTAEPRATRSAVKLSSTLLTENSRFRTEPSLLRRRSAPAEEEDLIAAGLKRRRRSIRLPQQPLRPVLFLVGFLALLVGGLVVLVAHYRTAGPSETTVWDNGLDGQPGYLDLPRASRAQNHRGGRQGPPATSASAASVSATSVSATSAPAASPESDAVEGTSRDASSPPVEDAESAAEARGAERKLPLVSHSKERPPRGAPRPSPVQSPEPRATKASQVPADTRAPPPPPQVPRGSGTKAPEPPTEIWLE